MPHPDIVAYYLLCSVDSHRAPHVLNALERNEYSKLINTPESGKLIKVTDDGMVAREFVIGGKDTASCIIIG